jgi:hypothetical protein
VVLRRLDCILDSSKAAVLDMAASLPADMDDEARDTVLSGVVGENIKLYNLSRFTFELPQGPGREGHPQKPYRLHHQVLAQRPRNLPREVPYSRISSSA